MATKPANKETKDSGGKGFIIGMLAATVLAVGGGAVFGLQLGAMLPKTPAGHEAGASSGQGQGHGGSHGGGHGDQGHGADKSKLETGELKLLPLPPLLSNVASPSDVWVRIEAQAIFEGKDEEAKLLLPKVTEDLLAYLKTVTLAQIEGPSGFQHLREDLEDRARVRSAGKIHELVFGGFIIE